MDALRQAVIDAPELVEGVNHSPQPEGVTDLWTHWMNSSAEQRRAFLVQVRKQFLARPRDQNLI